MGLYELMVMNDDLRDMIVAEALDRRAAATPAASTAWRPCASRACRRSTTGITTIEEVVRETVLEDDVSDEQSVRECVQSTANGPTRLRSALAST